MQDHPSFTESPLLPTFTVLLVSAVSWLVWNLFRHSSPAAMEGAAGEEGVEKYSIVVIGAGSGGLTAASFAAKLGSKVALVEGHRLGGDCTWTGCVPSKALIKASKMAHHARTAGRYGVVGVDASAIKVDLSVVHDQVQQVIQNVYQHETPEKVAEQGVHVIMGKASFQGKHELLITPTSGEAPHTIHGSRFVLCTGASPRVPEALQGVPHSTYEDIFDNKVLPDSMAVVGGGPIGAEIAQAYQRMGCQVTIVASHILPKEDQDGRDVLCKVFAREGIKHVASRAASARVEDGKIHLSTAAGDVLVVDKLFVAAGRVPRMKELNLDAAGVVHSPKGIRVDNWLRTNVSHIYAAGDCVGSQQFTHYAAWQAFMAVRNLVLPSSSKGVTDIVPRVTFTDPEIAAVGMTEEEFREKVGDRGRIVMKRLPHVDRAVCEREEDDGFFKIMFTKDYKIRGASIVCQRAGEIINEVAVAMKSGIKVSDLGSTIHAYPSFSFALQQMCSEIAIESLFHGKTGAVIKLLKKA